MPLVAALAGIALLQAAWKPRTFPPGFTLDLPAAPTRLTDEDLPSGALMWTSMHQGKNPIIVGWYPMDEPERSSPPDLLLAELVGGAAEGAEAKVTAQKEIILDGWLGVEYRMQSDIGIRSIGRHYIVGGSALQFLVSSDSFASAEPPAKKLFASIRLPAKLGKGPHTKVGPEMRRFPIGDTGATVEMPREPIREDVTLPTPNKMTVHRFTSRYLNRTYLATYIDVSREDFDADNPDQVDMALKTFHDQMVKTFRGKNQRDESIKVSGFDGLRTIASTADGAGFVRAESTIYRGRLITFVVTVPAFMSKSPDLDRYFASIQVGS